MIPSHSHAAISISIPNGSVQVSTQWPHQYLQNYSLLDSGHRKISSFRLGYAERIGALSWHKIYLR